MIRLDNNNHNNRDLPCNYYSEFFHFVNDGLTILDFTEEPDGKYIEVNDVFCKMLDYSHDELIGHSPVEIAPDAFKNELRQFIHGQRYGLDRQITKEIVFATKGGRHVITELSGHVVEHNDRVIGFGIHHDITRLKQIEKELRSAYENESHLRYELEARNNRRIAFTRALVHEMKTSLTPIMCNIKVLANMPSDETSQLLTQNISRAASTLNHRIDEHYDLICGEVGTLELECSWVNPSELLDGIYSEFFSRISLNKKRFAKDIEQDIPLIWVDNDRVKQIIENLLDNAEKYTPEGATIVLRARHSDSKLYFSVEDNGPGIPRIAQGQVFHSYYRFLSTTKKTGGLGLGLALCRQLAKLHGGNIRVRENKPHGCIFIVSIPYKE